MHRPQSLQVFAIDVEIYKRDTLRLHQTSAQTGTSRCVRRSACSENEMEMDCTLLPANKSAHVFQRNLMKPWEHYDNPV